LTAHAGWHEDGEEEEIEKDGRRGLRGGPRGIFGKQRGRPRSGGAPQGLAACSCLASAFAPPASAWPCVRRSCALVAFESRRKPATRPLDLSVCVCGHVQVGPNALRNAHSNRRKGSRRKSERPTKSGSVSAGTESACVSTTTARSRAWFRADPSGVTVPGMTGMMPRDRSFS
jgi:hypothetical protein